MKEDIKKLAEVVSEVLDIHPDPLKDEDAYVEISMGEILKIVERCEREKTLKTYPSTNPIMVIFNMATDLWYATVSKEKMRGGHPGVAGPSSSDDYDNEIGHLEGICQTIKDILYAKKEMYERITQHRK